MALPADFTSCPAPLTVLQPLSPPPSNTRGSTQPECAGEDVTAVGTRRQLTQRYPLFRGARPPSFKRQRITRRTCLPDRRPAVGRRLTGPQAFGQTDRLGRSRKPECHKIAANPRRLQGYFRDLPVGIGRIVGREGVAENSQQHFGRDQPKSGIGRPVATETLPGFAGFGVHSPRAFPASLPRPPPILALILATKAYWLYLRLNLGPRSIRSSR